jgi:uncharacterized protein YcaQ
MRIDISASEARRIALTAQGFNSLSRDRIINAADIRKVIDKLGLLQIDSVNVLVRAHYVPLFSRLGVYDRAVLDALSVSRPRRYFEYWGHEASLLPIDCQPLLRWRMADAYQGKGIWRPFQTYACERKSEAEALLDRIRTEGPLAASDLAGSKASKGMWVWTEAKKALEWLFWAGLISATHRRNSFEKVYDLPERVLPPSILRLPTPDVADAKRALFARSAQALGIATASDIRDYFRIPAEDTGLLLEQLVEEGTLCPVKVSGWTQQAYLHKNARAGRSIKGPVLLSPFDPLIWCRPRTERLFGFLYRLEIYTPSHKREYGYYVLQFLLDGQLVARVDLKADRANAALIVQRLHVEPNAPGNTIERLMEELRLMGSWLSLSCISVVSQPNYDRALSLWIGIHKIG